MNDDSSFEAENAKTKTGQQEEWKTPEKAPKPYNVPSGSGDIGQGSLSRSGTGRRRHRRGGRSHADTRGSRGDCTATASSSRNASPTPQRRAASWRSHRDSQNQAPAPAPPSFLSASAAAAAAAVAASTTASTTASTPQRPLPRPGLSASRRSAGQSRASIRGAQQGNDVEATPTKTQRGAHQGHSQQRISIAGHPSLSMASAAGKWREEQILIICPGSQTTMAQLGCSELTPPGRRFPTRMFRDGHEWRPYYTYKRVKVVDGAEQEEWVEDVDEDKDAVWPMQGGRIVHMEALLAFLDHVHSLLTTTYHNTPIMLMASPQWTRPDCEMIARYIFEKTKTPALCMIHSGLATQYGLKWPNMTVVDIGFEKVDVTAIHDGRVVNHMDLGAPQPDRQISGGEVFTQSLLSLLRDKGFNRDMAEQLKKSSVCEVLPYAAAAKELAVLPVEASPGSMLVIGGGLNAAEGQEIPQGGDGSDEATPATPTAAAPAPAPAPAPAHVNDHDEEGDGAEANVDDDGVLDVASIVTSGQTKEFLAKKERERGKPGRKPKDKEAAEALKPARLPNSKRMRNSFLYEEIIQEQVPREHGKAAAEAEAVPAVEAPNEAPTDPHAKESPPEAAGNGTTADSKPAEASPPPEFEAKRIRRDIEVGLERFTFAQRQEIDRIVSTIYRTIQGIDDMYMRPACWDNLVFVGNGSRLRGLKDNILQTLQARHLISPSTATMFTSELPSNVATPAGTGSQTPTGSFTGAPHQLPSSGVNPLLQAATTASTLGGNIIQASAAAAAAAAGTPQPVSEAAGPASSHHFHSQTPTSIKTAGLPTYLSEWSKNGFEEAMFLGAQVAARIAFCVHSNIDAQGVEAQRMMSLSRVDYNEMGPKAIRTHSMLS